LIYIGTGSGLDVYDGIHIFKINTGNTQAIFRIFDYGSDSLILVKQNSVGIINRHNYGFRLVDYSDSIRNVMNEAVLVNNAIYCSSEDGLVKITLPDLRYK